MNLVAAAVAFGTYSFGEVQAFLPPTDITTNINIISNHATATSTALYMGKKKKPSMKERRKARAKKQPGFTVDRGLLNDLPAADAWEKTVVPKVAAPDQEIQVKYEGADDDADVKVDAETEETFAKASSLVQQQRESVDSLSFIHRRVEEALPFDEAAKSIAEKGYFAYDNFLTSGEDEAFGSALISEMLQEGSDMLSNDKLERDITRLGDGEYLAKIEGGEAYANCPRLTEYVVSLTRHLPPMLNEELDSLETGDVSKLDGTASMGTLRLYDHKTRAGAEALLMKTGSDENDGQDRPFGIVCGDNEGTENDTRRLTAMLFLSSKDWDASARGSGVTIENGEKLDGVRDRIIFLRSDTCSHRMEPWKGEGAEGLEQASCVTVHFVKEIA